MGAFSLDEQLNREHEAYKKMSGFVHGVYLLGFAVTGIWCLVQIMDAGSILALTWKQVWKLLLCVPMCLYFLGAMSGNRGVFAQLNHWEQSLLQRRELEELKLSLR